MSVELKRDNRRSNVIHGSSSTRLIEVDYASSSKQGPIFRKRRQSRQSEPVMKPEDVADEIMFPPTDIMETRKKTKDDDHNNKKTTRRKRRTKKNGKVFADVESASAIEPPEHNMKNQPSNDTTSTKPEDATVEDEKPSSSSSELKPKQKEKDSHSSSFIIGQQQQKCSINNGAETRVIEMEYTSQTGGGSNNNMPPEQHNNISSSSTSESNKNIQRQPSPTISVTTTVSTSSNNTTTEEEREETEVEMGPQQRQHVQTIPQKKVGMEQQQQQHGENNQQLKPRSESSSKEGNYAEKEATASNKSEIEVILDSGQQQQTSKIPFPEKLFNILKRSETDPTWAKTISWAEEGTAVEVHNVEGFEDIVMPTVFTRCDMGNFCLQLKWYGFDRVGNGVYRHRNFTRNNHKQAIGLVRLKGTPNKFTPEFSNFKTTRKLLKISHQKEIAANNMEERKIIVTVPAGKLGFALTNRKDGKGTIISDIINTSPIATELSLGDRLVEIDSVDVTGIDNVPQILSILASKIDQKRQLTIITSNNKCTQQQQKKKTKKESKDIQSRKEEDMKQFLIQLQVEEERMRKEEEEIKKRQQEEVQLQDELKPQEEKNAFEVGLEKGSEEDIQVKEGDKSAASTTGITISSSSCTEEEEKELHKKKKSSKPPPPPPTTTTTTIKDRAGSGTDNQTSDIEIPQCGQNSDSQGEISDGSKINGSSKPDILTTGTQHQQGERNVEDIIPFDDNNKSEVLQLPKEKQTTPSSSSRQRSYDKSDQNRALDTLSDNCDDDDNDYMDTTEEDQRRQGRLGTHRKVKRSGRRSEFPMHLWAMLNDFSPGTSGLVSDGGNGTEQIVSWAKEGTAFQVYNVDSFVKNVIPKYFDIGKRGKVATCDAYQRFKFQLQWYGFEKAEEISDDCFRHEQFTRDDRQQSEQILRWKHYRKWTKSSTPHKEKRSFKQEQDEEEQASMSMPLESGGPLSSPSSSPTTKTMKRGRRYDDSLEATALSSPSSPPKPKKKRGRPRKYCNAPPVYLKSGNDGLDTLQQQQHKLPSTSFEKTTRKRDLPLRLRDYWTSPALEYNKELSSSTITSERTTKKREQNVTCASGGDRKKRKAAAEPSTVLKQGVAGHESKKRKVGGMQPTFPEKLWAMLNRSETDPSRAQIVSWVDNGTAFRVHNRTKFATKIIPDHFKVGKTDPYQNFKVKLMWYGFERVDDDYFRHKKFSRQNKIESLQIPRLIRAHWGKGNDDGNYTNAMLSGMEHHGDSDDDDDDDDDVPLSEIKKRRQTMEQTENDSSDDDDDDDDDSDEVPLSEMNRKRQIMEDNDNRCGEDDGDDDRTSIDKTTQEGNSIKTHATCSGKGQTMEEVAKDSDVDDDNGSAIGKTTREGSSRIASQAANTTKKQITERIEISNNDRDDGKVVEEKTEEESGCTTRPTTNATAVVSNTATSMPLPRKESPQEAAALKHKDDGKAIEETTEEESGCTTRPTTNTTSAVSNTATSVLPPRKEPPQEAALKHKDDGKAVEETTEEDSGCTTRPTTNTTSAVSNIATSVPPPRKEPPQEAALKHKEETREGNGKKEIADAATKVDFTNLSVSELADAFQKRQKQLGEILKVMNQKLSKGENRIHQLGKHKEQAETEEELGNVDNDAEIRANILREMNIDSLDL